MWAFLRIYSVVDLNEPVKSWLPKGNFKCSLREFMNDALLLCCSAVTMGKVEDFNSPNNFFFWVGAVPTNSGSCRAVLPSRHHTHDCYFCNLGRCQDGRHATACCQDGLQSKVSCHVQDGHQSRVSCQVQDGRQSRVHCSQDGRQLLIMVVISLPN